MSIANSARHPGRNDRETSIHRVNCRLFSMIVAGLNCFYIPLGTVLGAFTFIVLTRESVRALYESART